MGFFIPIQPRYGGWFGCSFTVRSRFVHPSLCSKYNSVINLVNALILRWMCMCGGFLLYLCTLGIVNLAISNDVEVAVVENFGGLSSVLP